MLPSAAGNQRNQGPIDFELLHHVDELLLACWLTDVRAGALGVRADNVFLAITCGQHNHRKKPLFKDHDSVSVRVDLPLRVTQRAPL